MNESTIGFNLHITLLMALEGLRSIVERFGEDHTPNGDGQGCIYVAPTSNHVLKPVCIVGHFAHDLGILRALTTAGDSEHAHDGIHGSLCNLGALTNEVAGLLKNRHGITFDPDALAFLQSAQTIQDNGGAWGEALETASQQVLDSKGYHHQKPSDRLLDLL